MHIRFGITGRRGAFSAVCYDKFTGGIIHYSIKSYATENLAQKEANNWSKSYPQDYTIPAIICIGRSHQWSSWRNSNRLIEVGIPQHRICLLCGKKQHRLQ